MTERGTNLCRPTWRVAAGGLIMLALGTATAQPLRLHAQSPVSQLLPVDEAVEQPTFFTFRAQLQEAIARRDIDDVMAAVDPNIKASFGGDDGIDAFRKMWRPSDADSKFWGALATVLALGGTFQDAQTFVAPYTYSRWPEQYDSFEHVVLIAGDVRIREAPRPDAPVMTTRSLAVLPLARVPSPIDEAWKAVRVDARRVGYVSSRLVRSPIDYRAFFTLRNGRWLMTMFVAGD